MFHLLFIIIKIAIIAYFANKAYENRQWYQYGTTTQKTRIYLWSFGVAVLLLSFL
jgi:hypothetical protein